MPAPHTSSDVMMRLWGALLLLILINLWKITIVFQSGQILFYVDIAQTSCQSALQWRRKKSLPQEEHERRDSSSRTRQIRLEIVSGLLAAVVLNHEVVSLGDICA